VLQHSLTQEDVFVDNTAFVNAVDPAGTEVSDDDDATVQVLTPGINLEKSVDQTLVAPGTPVTYTFTVTNTGNDPLTDITLTDDHCTPTFVGGDTDGDGALDLTETWTYTCAGVVITNDPTINQALVIGTPSLGPDVSDPADAQVDVVHQDLQLVKSVDFNVVFSGDPVTYTYVLTNPSADDPLVTPEGTTHLNAVADDSCAPVTFVSSTGNEDDTLAPGEAWTYTCTLDSVTEVVLNTATAVMVGPVGELTRTDVALVVPVESDIVIVKRASDDIVPAGSPVTYTYEVRNTGLIVPLASVTVTDDTCADPTFVEGDTDGDDLLDPGEVWVYTCTATITETTTNIATATGVPSLPDGRTDEPVDSTDTETVTAYTPDIELVKTVSSSLVPVGTPVTYTFVATNTGDIELVNVTLVDDQCAPVSDPPVESIQPADNVMQPGETWTWTCGAQIDVDTTNVATVSGFDPDGEEVTDDDDAEVVVFVSEIVLHKTSDPILVPEGGSTTFTFEVTNPSTVPLSDITLTDNRCSPLTFVGGDTNGDDILAPLDGEIWTYTCTMPISQLTVNTAVVTGTDPGGGQPSDTGFAGALPYLPGIAVVKTPSATEVEPGDSVTYTYQVTNTGNIPLANVAANITDDKCSPVTYVSGDDDGNNLLTPPIGLLEYAGETWIFTCTTQISENTTNVVTVRGDPVLPDGTPLGPPVSDSDTATVTTGLAGTGFRPQLIGIGAAFVAGGLLLLGGSRVARQPRPRRALASLRGGR
jgi:uncharacterized repeat protein (TIGR01451 family)